jgi:hypothetical protein
MVVPATAIRSEPARMDWFSHSCQKQKVNIHTNILTWFELKWIEIELSWHQAKGTAFVISMAHT